MADINSRFLDSDREVNRANAYFSRMCCVLTEFAYLFSFNQSSHAGEYSATIHLYFREKLLIIHSRITT